MLSLDPTDKRVVRSRVKISLRASVANWHGLTYFGFSTVLLFEPRMNFKLRKNPVL